MARSRRQILEHLCLIAAAEGLLIPLYRDQGGIVYGIDRGNYIEVVNR